MRCSAAIDRLDTTFDGMLRIPGGTFRMGSDKHYPEEAPVHSVTVDEFFIDCTPVTNRQFKEFVRATGHITFAEIPPDPKNYPGALPHMLYAGSLVFSPPAQAVEEVRLVRRRPWATVLPVERLAIEIFDAPEVALSSRVRQLQEERTVRR